MCNVSMSAAVASTTRLQTLVHPLGIYLRYLAVAYHPALFNHFNATSSVHFLSTTHSAFGICIGVLLVGRGSWVVLEQAGNNAGALGKYKEGLKLLPSKDVDAAALSFHKNIAACYVRMSQWKDVIKACDAALKLSPTDVKALYRRMSCSLSRVLMGGRVVCTCHLPVCAAYSHACSVHMTLSC